MLRELVIYKRDGKNTFPEVQVSVKGAGPAGSLVPGAAKALFEKISPMLEAGVQNLSPEAVSDPPVSGKGFD